MKSNYRKKKPKTKSNLKITAKPESSIDYLQAILLVIVACMGVYSVFAFMTLDFFFILIPGVFLLWLINFIKIE